MSAVLIAIADAVVDELNLISWTPRFQAKRQNAPRLFLEEIESGTVVTVTPKSRTTQQITRGTVQGDHEIYVAIQRRVASDANAESDPLIELGETIAEYFDDGRRLKNYQTAICRGTQFGSGTDSQWLHVQDQQQILLYTGIVLLTFRVFR